ncbi:hypothetical protein C9374_005814 [Naegleria lovaniensis]|uniref:UBA domain-containing protein n=1 Tax=Naegleria lovaniensis TaxID=51637 RepID=A0AA88KIB2_NAELO|nr:uncharacterized protein C9374_005814 [Naegleria lovaniensis]KAG2382022.1 hypothetical protein C9374_005814 [Naegleria lovaniensis]
MNSSYYGPYGQQQQQPHPTPTPFGQPPLYNANNNNPMMMSGVGGNNNTSGMYPNNNIPMGSNNTQRPNSANNNNNNSLRSNNQPPMRTSTTSTPPSSNQRPPMVGQQPYQPPQQPPNFPTQTHLPTTSTVVLPQVPGSYGQPVLIIPSTTPTQQPQPTSTTLPSSHQQNEAIHMLVQTVQQHLEQTKQWKLAIDEQIQYMDLKLSAILDFVKKQDPSAVRELENYERMKNKNSSVNNSQTNLNTNAVGNNNNTTVPPSQPPQQNSQQNSQLMNTSQLNTNLNASINNGYSAYTGFSNIPSQNSNIPNNQSQYQPSQAMVSPQRDTMVNKETEKNKAFVMSNDNNPPSYAKPPTNFNPPSYTEYNQYPKTPSQNYSQPNQVIPPTSSLDLELDELDRELSRPTFSQNKEPNKDFESDVQLICNLGFSEETARNAMMRCGNRAAAINYLLDINTQH